VTSNSFAGGNVPVWIEKERVLRDLDLQNRVGRDLEHKVSRSADELNDLREELRQPQEIISGHVIGRDAAIKTAIEEERTRESPRRMTQQGIWRRG
jgi:hypothetical protein